jgi:hypothetical protein
MVKSHVPPGMVNTRTDGMINVSGHVGVPLIIVLTLT